MASLAKRYAGRLGLRENGTVLANPVAVATYHLCSRRTPSTFTCLDCLIAGNA